MKPFDSLRSLRAIGVLLFAPGMALAQPTTTGSDCPPDLKPPLLDASDVCSARIVDIHSRILALGQQMCANTNPAASKAAEDKLAKEFGALTADCTGSLLKSDSYLVQAYLYSWLNGPSEGWGEDTKVNGVKIPEDLRNYRDTVTSYYGSGLAAEKLPDWYKKEAAYSEALTALLGGARDYMKANSSWALSEAESRIERFQTNTGASNDDPRVKFLKEMLGRIKTPNTTAIPPELLEAYAKNPPIRLNGPAGFYTQLCDAKAAKDASLNDALSLALAAHLSGNGPAKFETFDGAVNALKGSYASFARADAALGSEMAGAWMTNYVAKTYFSGDSNVQNVSPEMARALGESVTNPLRERYGLPKAASSEHAGDALGLGGSKFDSNDSLRVVFPGKCDLTGVYGVKTDGTTGDLLKETGWSDPRGIYDPESWENNKDFPITELVFKETSGVNKDKNRSYDVVMKCGDRTRKTRISIPPRADTTEPIDFITPDTAPPYKDMLADGALNGLMVGGYHTRDGEVAVKAMKELGFREVSRNENVNLRDRFFELLGEKKNGKPVLDYFVKDAHANGYAYDAGMFRANKVGQEVVLEKIGPDGKKHRITLLGNKKGEGKEGGPEGFDTVDYAKYFDVMAARGTATTFVANFSCWSMSKSAFEADGIRSKTVKYLPTDKSASYWESYWSGMASRENTFQIVAALDKKMDYPTMRSTYSNFDDEIIMPDDPTFVPSMTDAIKSHRSGSSGIPVRIGLQESRPSS